MVGLPIVKKRFHEAGYGRNVGDTVANVVGECSHVSELQLAIRCNESSMFQCCHFNKYLISGFPTEQNEPSLVYTDICEL